MGLADFLRKKYNVGKENEPERKLIEKNDSQWLTLIPSNCAPSCVEEIEMRSVLKNSAFKVKASMEKAKREKERSLDVLKLTSNVRCFSQSMLSTCNYIAKQVDPDDTEVSSAKDSIFKNVNDTKNVFGALVKNAEIIKDEEIKEKPPNRVEAQFRVVAKQRVMRTLKPDKHALVHCAAALIIAGTVVILQSPENVILTLAGVLIVIIASFLSGRFFSHEMPERKQEDENGAVGLTDEQPRESSQSNDARFDILRALRDEYERRAEDLRVLEPEVFFHKSRELAENAHDATVTIRKEFGVFDDAELYSASQQ